MIRQTMRVLAMIGMLLHLAAAAEQAIESQQSSNGNIPLAEQFVRSLSVIKGSDRRALQLHKIETTTLGSEGTPRNVGLTRRMQKQRTMQRRKPRFGGRKRSSKSGKNEGGRGVRNWRPAGWNESSRRGRNGNRQSSGKTGKNGIGRGVGVGNGKWRPAGWNESSRRGRNGNLPSSGRNDSGRNRSGSKPNMPNDTWKAPNNLGWGSPWGQGWDGGVKKPGYFPTKPDKKTPYPTYYVPPAPKPTRKPTPQPTDEPDMRLIEVTMDGMLTATDLDVPAEGSNDIKALASAFEKTIRGFLGEKYQVIVFQIGEASVISNSVQNDDEKGSKKDDKNKLDSSRKRKQRKGEPRDLQAGNDYEQGWDEWDTNFWEKNEMVSWGPGLAECPVDGTQIPVFFVVKVIERCFNCDDEKAFAQGADTYRQTFAVLDDAVKTNGMSRAFCMNALRAGAVTTYPCGVSITCVTGISYFVQFVDEIIDTSPAPTPSISDTDEPTYEPTQLPTEFPTALPTTQFPTFPPTTDDLPTLLPTPSDLFPTSNPTRLEPTLEPTLDPTVLDPTVEPTVFEPTVDPTVEPTVFEPTVDPTVEPTVLEPTVDPTVEPTVFEPTVDPTVEPTVFDPTVDPTVEPTVLEPTVDPTAEPTVLEPTVDPTVEPTVLEPTVDPTVEPTVLDPTVDPTLQPTPVPSPTGVDDNPTFSPTFSEGKPLFIFGSSESVGNSESIDYEVPFDVGEDVIYASAGSEYTLVILDDESAAVAGFIDNFDDYSGYFGLPQQDLSEGSNELAVIDSIVNLNGDLRSAPKFRRVQAGVKTNDGTMHSVFIDVDGNVYAAGSNNSGQLCIGDLDDRNVPHQIDLGEAAVSAAVGGDFTLILGASGDVYGCGSNEFGQLGLANVLFVDLPDSGNGLRNVRTISAGLDFSILSTEDGLAVMGSNSEQQLCTDEFDEVTEPYFLDAVGAEDSRQFRASAQSSYILFRDGSVAACGLNAFGQLGIGEFDDPGPATVNIPDNNFIKTVGVGPSALSAFFVGLDGVAYGAGRNNRGQLGVGDRDDRESPEQVLFEFNADDVTRISAAFDHTLAW